MTTYEHTIPDPNRALCEAIRRVMDAGQDPFTDPTIQELSARAGITPTRTHELPHREPLPARIFNKLRQAN